MSILFCPQVSKLNRQTIPFSLLYFIYITKTRLYNFDPFKPHFYIVKLGSTGVYIIFVISAQKTQIVGTRKNRLDEAVLTSTHNLCF